MASYVEAVFIGGPWDGKRSIVESRRRSFKIAKPLSRNVASFAKHCDITPFAYVTYARIDLHGCDLPIYAESGMTIEQVMHALVTGYRRAKETGQ